MKYLVFATSLVKFHQLISKMSKSQYKKKKNKEGSISCFKNVLRTLSYQTKHGAQEIYKENHEFPKKINW